MSSTNQLLAIWHRCQRLPLGNRVFSAIISWSAPFTGTVRPLVTGLEPGRCEVQMRERRRVRQHLKSVHAGALFTLAEAASGMAMMASIPNTARAIVTSMEISYHKKARGRLQAVGTCELPDLASRHDDGDLRVPVEIVVIDEANDTVCTATAQWNVRPPRSH